MSTMTENPTEEKPKTATKTYYAWSLIDFGAEHDENDRKLILTRNVIKVGQKVTPSDLGFENYKDPRWRELVDAGSIRDYQLPEDLRDPNTSPQKIVSARLAAMAEGVDTGNLDSTIIANLMTRPTNATEGVQEITPEGELTKPESEPPPAATSTR